MPSLLSRSARWSRRLAGVLAAANVALLAGGCVEDNEHFHVCLTAEPTVKDSAGCPSPEEATPDMRESVGYRFREITSSGAFFATSTYGGVTISEPRCCYTVLENLDP